MYRNHNTCRACGNTSLVPVFDLGIQPLANSFRTLEEEQTGHAPLKVLFCEECTLAQLSVVVDPQIIYSKSYPYVTSRSETMQAHFGSLWAFIKEECNPESVVEIGSNDGHFLKFCKEHGASAVMGIDPAENLRPDDKSGIISICGMFDCASASIAHTAMPAVDVIIARHVFAHIDDWQGFIKNLDVLASKETLIAIEVPYVMDMLKKVELDTVYHEHLSYVSIQSVQALLAHSPFHIHRVGYFTIHGEAMVLMLRRNDSARYPHSFATDNVTLNHWSDFRNYARTGIQYLKDTVEAMNGKDKIVCGFGASAKSTVWISACGFTVRNIKFILDCTPGKQGKCSPGTEIPIFPEEGLDIFKPDYAVLFSWNFKDEIIAKNKAYLDAGGHFIIPGKKLEIV